MPHVLPHRPAAAGKYHRPAARPDAPRHLRMDRPGGPHDYNAVCAGADYTPGQVEFLQALQALKERRRLVRPSEADVLGVLDGLGYTRPAGPLAPRALAAALGRLRAATGRKFLAWTEWLAVLLSEGYARAAA